MTWLSLSEISQQLQIPLRTLNRWRSQFHPYIASQIRNGKRYHPDSCIEVFRSIQQLRQENKTYQEICDHLSRQFGAEETAKRMKTAGVPPEEPGVDEGNTLMAKIAQLEKLTADLSDALNLLGDQCAELASGYSMLQQRLLAAQDRWEALSRTMEERERLTQRWMEERDLQLIHAVREVNRIKKKKQKKLKWLHALTHLWTS